LFSHKVPRTRRSAIKERPLGTRHHFSDVLVYMPVLMEMSNSGSWQRRILCIPK